MTGNYPSRLRGVVVDSAGAVVEGAEIRWGCVSTRSDAAGNFECVWPTREASSPRMVAVAEGKADIVLFLDAKEEYVPMWSMTQNGMHPKNFIQLDGSQSAEFAISERAKWITYWSDGKELHRREVALVPGQLNRIAL